MVCGPSKVEIESGHSTHFYYFFFLMWVPKGPDCFNLTYDPILHVVCGILFSDICLVNNHTISHDAAIGLFHIGQVSIATDMCLWKLLASY